MTTTSRTAPPARRKGQLGPAGKAGDFADQRVNSARGVRVLLNKVFPDHWSFELGQVALWSFVILLLSGTYLTFFFDPSMAETTYTGSYAPLHDVEMSKAYSSTLKISFDVRGGLFIRQIHHWAALLFIAAMIAHMMRVFFTGAFRKPRELNWIIGGTLLMMGLLEGVTGYTLPDDLLSGTGLRIISAIILSIPVIGSWAYFLVFNGDYPGMDIIPRFFILHVLLIPGLILALIALHLALVVKQKHTQFAGPGKTEHNVIGERSFPTYGAKAGGFFAMVFGVLALMGGLLQINPIWLFGPYNPSQVGAGAQPDWYIGFLEGLARIWPSWEIHLPWYTVSEVFWPTVVVPGILFNLLFAYPFIEAKLTGDRAHHNLLQRPRDVPVRTSLGAMALTFYVVLWASGGNDVIAERFDISLNATTWMGRLGVLLLPPIVYLVTYRICLGLQHHDREVLEHGVETGIIKRLPSGEFIEVHQPLGPVDEHGHGTLQYAGAPVPKKMNAISGTRRRVVGFFSPVEVPADIEQEQPLELEREPEPGRELAGRE